MHNKMLLNSLKEIRIHDVSQSKKTFFKTFKASLSIPTLFEAKVTLERKKL
jgi:hypothetical protein